MQEAQKEKLDDATYNQLLDLRPHLDLESMVTTIHRGWKDGLVRGEELENGNKRREQEQAVKKEGDRETGREIRGREK